MIKKIVFILFLALFSIYIFAKQDNYSNFAEWIGGLSTPTDKGKLTAFPLFSSCQHNLLNVSNMLKFEDLPEVNSERWLSLEDFENEHWIRISEFGGNYSVSNYGRIKSHERLRKVNNKGGKTMTKTHIMRLAFNKTHSGYWYVSFHTKSKKPSIKVSVHVLVAKYFIPNPLNLPCINHKDENTKFNSVENLEWCTYAYNNSYGTAIERAKITRSKNGISKKVGVYDKEMNLIKTYNSLYSAGKDYGVHRAIISDYCHNGKIWRGVYFKFVEI